MAFRSTLAEMLLQDLRQKADITPKHRYNKTTSQKDRFETDLIWVILRWMDKTGITIDLKI